MSYAMDIFLVMSVFVIGGFLLRISKYLREIRDERTDTKKWEHQILTASTTEYFRSGLNELGKDGWEIVSANNTVYPRDDTTNDVDRVLKSGDHSWTALLKRPSRD
jgi:hypothetical protein